MIYEQFHTASHLGFRLHRSANTRPEQSHAHSEPCLNPANRIKALSRDESELLEDDVVSLTSSDPGASALLGSTQEEQEMSEGEEAEAEPSQTSCPAYEELLEVMDRATELGTCS
ncbi:hypothetical protein QQF64_016235 [Cirrhinus molitorella]|uniref:Uncharacterized protein n=1 Tax=Cirrhinus molitorella TaxID=172907 RepID=A0ABR3LPS5_9TELE